MALSNPVSLFGIHSATLYSRTDRTPIAYLRVLGDASCELKGEFEDLNGGSQMYPWDSEVKSISSEISFTAREYPVAAMNLLLAGSLTSYTAAATGEVIDEANVYGTTVYSSTGIATVTVTSDDDDDLKEGEYVVKAVSATTVDVYAMSDVDFSRGTDGAYEDDYLKIASAQTITKSGATVLANYGITLTGGGDTIAMTIGDSMRFTVRRPTVTGVKLVIGKASSTFSEFGCILTGQKSSGGAISYLDIYRCKAAGMPLQFKEKGYSEWAITIKALYDSAKDGVFEFIRNA